MAVGYCSTCKSATNLISGGTNDDGRTFFVCEKCNGLSGKILGCVLCGEPRTIWADDGKICGVCGMEFLIGKRTLTKEQKAELAKWAVTIEVSTAKPAKK